MKLVFLTAFIVTLALVHEGLGVSQTKQPCQEPAKLKEQAYKTFEKRHIITEDFDRTSWDEWSSYLRDKNICGRHTWQTFILARTQSVQNICSDAGRLVKDAPASEGDYCMSSSPMLVYQVRSDIDCTVSDVQPLSQYVVVKCAMAGQNCLPIHYKATGNRMPSATHCLSP